MPDNKQKKPQAPNKPEKMPEKTPQEMPQRAPGADEEIDTGEHEPITQRNPAQKSPMKDDDDIEAGE